MQFDKVASFSILAFLLLLPPSFAQSKVDGKETGHEQGTWTGGGGGGTVEILSKAGGDFYPRPYLADVERRIKRSWVAPKGFETQKVVVIFKISKTGQMSDLRLDSPSQFAIANQAALTAIQNAAPFRKLPEDAGDSAEIRFTFDYNKWTGARLPQ